MNKDSNTIIKFFGVLALLALIGYAVMETIAGTENASTMSDEQLIQR